LNYLPRFARGSFSRLNCLIVHSTVHIALQQN